MFKTLVLSAVLFPSIALAGQCDNWFSDNFWQQATVEQVSTCIAENRVPAGDVNDWTMPMQLAAGTTNRPDLIAAINLATYGIDTTDEMGNTPMHIAARYNDTPTVIAALINAGNDINALTEDGSTPLHVAAYGNENVAMLEALINGGVMLDATDENGRTALHIASAFATNPSAVITLINAGVDTSILDNTGKSAFDYLEAGSSLLQAANAANAVNG